MQGHLGILNKYVTHSLIGIRLVNLLLRMDVGVLVDRRLSNNAQYQSVPTKDKTFTIVYSKKVLMQEKSFTMVHIINWPKIHQSKAPYTR